MGRRGLAVAIVCSFAACGQAATDGGQAVVAPGWTPTPTAAPTPTVTSRAAAVPSPPPGPRLIAPLSTSVSTSTRPILAWVADSDATQAQAQVDVCRDRGCQDVIVSFLAAGSPARPPEPLPAGVVFWRVSSDAVGGRTSAVWELTIPARDSGRAASWGSVPDFNGDGFGDLAVCVQANGSAPLVDQVRFFPGGRDGLATSATQTFSGAFGFAGEAGSAGDLDGDGFADLAVWNGSPLVPSQPQSATVTVYRGGPAGLSSPVTIDGPDAVFANPMRVLSAGDVNGDGYGDLLVGGSELAELFLGGPAGLSPTAVQTLAPPADGRPDARWPIGDGDFDGDGHPDAIISGAEGGLLYDGDGQTLSAHPGPTFAAFGALAGDFNGDGFADLASSVIFTGGPGGLTTVFQSVAGQLFDQGVGDVDGDGFSDVLSTVAPFVGVPEGDRLYFGSPTGCSSTACPGFVPLLVPGHPNPRFTGDGARGLGDVNGDGFADFVFFSPGAGAVYLFYGSRTGPPASPSVTIRAEPGFGVAVAGM
jgi:hypothetical protein